MKIILLLFSLLYVFSGLAQVTVSWYNYPNGVSVAVDQYDNVYTAYWDYNPAGDITLTKRNAAGSILWNATYNNTDNTRHEAATWVETDRAGNILVSGTIRSGYSNPVNAASLLMKYSPNGTLLWRVVYENSFDGSSTRKCLVDADNNIYVLGIGTGPNGQVAKVKKFSPDGVSLWNYFDNGNGAPVTFKFTPDNKIVIVHRGITGSINGYSKIDLNGNKIWSMTGITSLSGGDAAGDAAGNTYTINGANPGSTLTKLSPSGGIIWSKTNSIIGSKVEVGTDNYPVVGGNPAAGYGVVFLKYDSNGNLLWQNLDADGPILGLLAITPMKLDGSNAVYIAGSTMSEMGVCKVNSDGTSAWAATTPSGYPVFFVFGSDNSVYVTGGTTARYTQGGSVQVPAAPSNLAATASGSSVINLTWTDNSSTETSFVLQRSLSSGSGFSTIATLAANTGSYSNTGLSSSTTYYYRIQAANLAGGSAWSNVAYATTAPSGPPSAPGNLTATVAGCTSITLKWTDNSGNESNFDLRRSTSLNGTYTTVATLAANTTTFTNTGLTKGRKYYYKVRATNLAGNSAWSNTASASPACISLKSGAIARGNEMPTDGTFENILMFPNPVTGNRVNLILPSNTEFPVRMSIISLTGQKVIQMELSGINNPIETTGLKNGIYVLTVQSKDEIKEFKLQINTF